MPTDPKIDWDQLLQPVRIRPGASQLEAIETAAAAAGLRLTADGISLYLRRPDAANVPPGQGFDPGTALDGMVAHAGPFRVQATHIQTFAPQPTGELRLTVSAVGLPPSAAALLPTDRLDWLEVQVNDAKGRSLLNDGLAPAGPLTVASVFRPDRLGAGLLNDYPAQPIHVAAALPLRGLYRDVDRLASVRGSVRVLLPERVTEVTFSTLRVGERKAVDGGELELTRFDGQAPAGNMVIGFAARGKVQGELFVLVRGSTGVNLYSGRLRTGLPLIVGGQPTTAVVKAVQSCVVTYPFEFRDVPLPLPPAGPLALVFAPHASPVDVTKCELAAEAAAAGPVRPRTLRVTVANRANKAVEWLRFRVVVRDDAGAVVHESEEMFPEGIELRRTARAAIQAGRTETLGRQKTVSGSARTADAKVLEVGFLDGTNWKP
jgi:hypothetical protein